jgi:AraC-like DNA-binding protein
MELTASEQNWVMSRAFTDAGELAQALHDSGTEYVPLQAGPYEADHLALQLGPLLLQRVSDQAHVTRSTIDPRRAVLLLPLRQSLAPVVNGHACDDAESLLFAPGSEIHGLIPAPMEWAALSLPATDFQSLLELGGRPTSPASTASMRVLPRAADTKLRRALVSVTDAARTAPQALLSPQAAKACTEDIAELMREAFARADPHPPTPRGLRRSIRLVKAAEEFLHAHLSRPVFAVELCEALDVAPRTLHNAFVQACGMSPHAYLKRRRLMLAHAALKAGGMGAMRVKSVALGHGFWHLGHFARDYREMFGRPPSETAAAARSRLTR